MTDKDKPATRAVELGRMSDEHFGAVQIYRGLLDADVPTSGALDRPLRLRVTYQGCADAGVCYPPQTVVQTIGR